MSNERDEMIEAHRAQIKAILHGDEETVREFCRLEPEAWEAWRSQGLSLAHIAWARGNEPGVCLSSIFAGLVHMGTCSCITQAKAHAADGDPEIARELGIDRDPLIPADDPPDNWQPDEATLQRFSYYQLRARFGEVAG